MVLGITGSDGAGKGTVVEYLVTHKGFAHYSSREFIVRDIERQGLPLTRNQMRITGNELRALHGDDVVVKQAYERAQAEGKTKVVIESIRALAEAHYLKSRGGILLAVDADVQLRYERVQARRSETDKVSFEEFVAHEALERSDPDPHGMQKAAVMEVADVTLLNNGNVEALQHSIDEFLTTYGN